MTRSLLVAPSNSTPGRLEEFLHPRRTVSAGTATLRSFDASDPANRDQVTHGGPWHVRGRLLEYAEQLRATGRGDWADSLLERYPREASGELPRSGF